LKKKKKMSLMVGYTERKQEVGGQINYQTLKLDFRDFYRPWYGLSDYAALSALLQVQVEVIFQFWIRILGSDFWLQIPAAHLGSSCCLRGRRLVAKVKNVPIHLV